MFLRGILVLIIASTFACRGGELGGIEGFDSSVSYQVSSDGSKRFTYRVWRDINQRIIRSSRGTFDPEAFEEYMLAGATAQVEKDQFCRNGFFVIDRSPHPANGFLRGECRETATPEDVARWASS